MFTVHRNGANASTILADRSGEDAAGALPPATCQKCAGDVGEKIAAIARGVRGHAGHNHFGHECPSREMKGDFAPARERVVGAEAELALKPEREGEGGGDQQQVVEVAVKERAADMSVQPEAVERVERTRCEAERIEGVGKTFHSNAAMRRPLPRASRRRSTKGGR